MDIAVFGRTTKYVFENNIYIVALLAIVDNFIEIRTDLSHDVLERVDILVLLPLHDGDFFAELPWSVARHLGGFLADGRPHRIKPAECANIAICTSIVA